RCARPAGWRASAGHPAPERAGACGLLPDTFRLRSSRHGGCGAGKAEDPAGLDGNGFRPARHHQLCRGCGPCALRYRRSPGRRGRSSYQFQAVGLGACRQKECAAMRLSHTRLGLPILAALLAAVLLFAAGLMMARYEDQLYSAQQVKDITEQARILAASVTAAIAFDDPNAAREYV